MVYLGGQSLGGAHVQFIMARLIEERLKPTIDVVNTVSGIITQAPNPLYNMDMSRVAAITYTSPGVNDILQEVIPGFNPDDPAFQSSLVRHYTPEGELINRVGGAMVGGGGLVHYLPTNGSADIMYLHRIPLGIWDGVKSIAADFAALSGRKDRTPITYTNTI